jgi:hypothetical protein
MFWLGQVDLGVLIGGVTGRLGRPIDEVQDAGFERLGRDQPQRDRRLAFIEQPHALANGDRVYQQVQLVQKTGGLAAIPSSRGLPFPDVQSLVGAWASDELIAIFDEIEDVGPKIAAGMLVALHLKYQGKIGGTAANIDEYGRNGGSR